MPFLGRLHELVRTCQFTTFWQELEGESEAASGRSLGHFSHFFD